MRHTILLLSLSMVVGTHGWQGSLFVPGAPVSVGRGSGTVILADVNGDGHLDMLTRHLLTRIITIRFGDGRGGFAANPGGAMTFAYSPGEMKLGDVDSDGTLDLAVTSNNRDFVEVFRGDGRGRFTAIAGSPFTVSTAVDKFNKRTLHLVDLNEDGALDIVTANGRRRNTLGVLFGNGKGAFRPGPTVRLDSGREHYTYAFGDVDGDGHLDVASAGTPLGDYEGRARVVVQFGNGRGEFRADAGKPLTVAPGTRAVNPSDVNGDGRLDLVITHSGGLVSVLVNQGARRFAPAPRSPVTVGADSFATNVVDLNRDGTLDLVVATVNSISVLLGDGATFAAAPGSPFTAGPGAYNLTVGDVNEDGKTDVAASSFEGDAITVLLAR